MAAFDLQSGVRGAAAGNQVYPGYGAIAGFVIGGFIGGHKSASEKKKLKKKQRRYQKQWQEMLSPAYGAKLQSQFLPQYRNIVAQGIGPQLQSDVSTRLSRHGLTGSGLGEAMYGLGAIAPDIAANKMAQVAAGDLWNKKLDAFQQHALGENIGWMGQPIQKADPFGSAGALVDLAGSYGMSKGFSGQGLLGGGGFKHPYLGTAPGGGGFSQWKPPSNYGQMPYTNQFPSGMSFGNFTGAGTQQYSGPFMYQSQQRNPFYGLG